jgi:hypothetical protein
MAAAVGALLAAVGCGGGNSRSFGVTPSAADTPNVIVGGYEFGVNSSTLKHPDLYVAPSSPDWTGAGYGIYAGRTLTLAFAPGGLVAGVKTLRWATTIPPVGASYQWLAQDTLGNIHVLQVKSPGDPTRLVGVAGGYPAFFWLLRGADMTLGRTWYRAEGPFAPVRITQFRVTATGTNWRGGTGLLCVRMIEDTNRDHVFDPAWGGLDKRIDIYYDPVRHAMYGAQMAAKGGYVKAH